MPKDTDPDLPKWWLWLAVPIAAIGLVVATGVAATALWSKIGPGERVVLIAIIVVMLLWAGAFAWAHRSAFVKMREKRDRDRDAFAEREKQLTDAHIQAEQEWRSDEQKRLQALAAQSDCIVVVFAGGPADIVTRKGSGLAVACDLAILNACPLPVTIQSMDLRVIVELAGSIALPFIGHACPNVAGKLVAPVGAVPCPVEAYASREDLDREQQAVDLKEFLSASRVTVVGTAVVYVQGVAAPKSVSIRASHWIPLTK